MGNLLTVVVDSCSDVSSHANISNTKNVELRCRCGGPTPSVQTYLRVWRVGCSPPAVKLFVWKTVNDSAADEKNLVFSTEESYVVLLLYAVCLRCTCNKADLEDIPLSTAQDALLEQLSVQCHANIHPQSYSFPAIVVSPARSASVAGPPDYGRRLRCEIFILNGVSTELPVQMEATAFGKRLAASLKANGMSSGADPKLVAYFAPLRELKIPNPKNLHYLSRRRRPEHVGEAGATTTQIPPRWRQNALVRHFCCLPTVPVAEDIQTQDTTNGACSNLFDAARDAVTHASRPQYPPILSTDSACRMTISPRSVAKAIAAASPTVAALAVSPRGARSILDWTANTKMAVSDTSSSLKGMVQPPGAASTTSPNSALTQSGAASRSNKIVEPVKATTLPPQQKLSAGSTEEHRCRRWIPPDDHQENQTKAHADSPSSEIIAINSDNANHPLKRHSKQVMRIPGTRSSPVTESAAPPAKKVLVQKVKPLILSLGTDHPVQNKTVTDSTQRSCARGFLADQGQGFSKHDPPDSASSSTPVHQTVLPPLSLSNLKIAGGETSCSSSASAQPHSEHETVRQQHRSLGTLSSDHVRPSTTLSVTLPEPLLSGDSISSARDDHTGRTVTTPTTTALFSGDGLAIAPPLSSRSRRNLRRLHWELIRRKCFEFMNRDNQNVSDSNQSSMDCAVDDPELEAANKELLLAKYRTVCSEVIPGGRLYISGSAVSQSHLTLTNMGITHIVNMAGDTCKNFFPNHFRYVTYVLQDNRLSSAEIQAILLTTLDYIADVLSQSDKHRILIHCREVVVAYLMWVARLRFRDALEILRITRPMCNPNTGFTYALLRFEKLLLANETQDERARQHKSAEDATDHDAVVDIDDVDDEGAAVLDERLRFDPFLLASKRPRPQMSLAGASSPCSYSSPLFSLHSSPPVSSFYDSSSTQSSSSTSVRERKLLRVCAHDAKAPFLIALTVSTYEPRQREWMPPQVTLDPRFYYIARNNEQIFLWRGSETVHRRLTDYFFVSEYLRQLRLFEGSTFSGIAWHVSYVVEAEEPPQFWDILYPADGRSVIPERRVARQDALDGSFRVLQQQEVLNFAGYVQRLHSGRHTTFNMCAPSSMSSGRRPPSSTRSAQRLLVNEPASSRRSIGSGSRYASRVPYASGASLYRDIASSESMTVPEYVSGRSAGGSDRVSASLSGDPHYHPDNMSSDDFDDAASSVDTGPRCAPTVRRRFTITPSRNKTHGAPLLSELEAAAAAAAATSAEETRGLVLHPDANRVPAATLAERRVSTSSVLQPAPASENVPPRRLPFITPLKLPEKLSLQPTTNVALMHASPQKSPQRDHAAQHRFVLRLRSSDLGSPKDQFDMTSDTTGGPTDECHPLVNLSCINFGRCRFEEGSSFSGTNSKNNDDVATSLSAAEDESDDDDDVSSSRSSSYSSCSRSEASQLPAPPPPPPLKHQQQRPRNGPSTVVTTTIRSVKVREGGINLESNVPYLYRWPDFNQPIDDFNDDDLDPTSFIIIAQYGPTPLLEILGRRRRLRHHCDDSGSVHDVRSPKRATAEPIEDDATYASIELDAETLVPSARRCSNATVRVPVVLPATEAVKFTEELYTSSVAVGGAAATSASETNPQCHQPTRVFPPKLILTAAATAAAPAETTANPESRGFEGSFTPVDFSSRTIEISPHAGSMISMRRESGRSTNVQQQQAQQQSQRRRARDEFPRGASFAVVESGSASSRHQDWRSEQSTDDQCYGGTSHLEGSPYPTETTALFTRLLPHIDEVEIVAKASPTLLWIWRGREWKKTRYVPTDEVGENEGTLSPRLSDDELLAQFKAMHGILPEDPDVIEYWEEDGFESDDFQKLLWLS